MALRPLNDSILLKPRPHDYTSDLNPEVINALKSGKLFLPEKYEGAYKKVVGIGEIVSWGNACKYKYKEGQTLYYGQFAGSKMKIGEDTLLVIREADALALVEDD